ncbi:MAG: formyltransferase family protein [Candidatus Aureabacteria bacterium]|nr:formyltransferase family protein [Candidatus Auribacterota bacterium]
MRIVLVTQEEPFYLPLFTRLFLEKLKGNIVLVVGLSAVPPQENRFLMARRFLILWGARLFAYKLLRYSYYRILDSLPIQLGTAIYSSRRHCIRMHIPYIAPQSLKGAYAMERIRACVPNLLVSVAANQIFSKELLSLPTLGCINLHASLLPRYRGINPTFWVLAKGEEITGVTVHFMNEKFDDGDIILQREISISKDDTLHSLYSKEIILGLDLLCEAISLLEKGSVPRKPNDSRYATYYSYPTRSSVKEFRERGRRFY